MIMLYSSAIVKGFDEYMSQPSSSRYQMSLTMNSWVSGELSFPEAVLRLPRRSLKPERRAMATSSGEMRTRSKVKVMVSSGVRPGFSFTVMVSSGGGSMRLIVGRELWRLFPERYYILGLEDLRKIFVRRP